MEGTTASKEKKKSSRSPPLSFKDRTPLMTWPSVTASTSVLIIFLDGVALCGYWYRMNATVCCTFRKIPQDVFVWNIRQWHRWPDYGPHPSAIPDKSKAPCCPKTCWMRRGRIGDHCRSALEDIQVDDNCGGQSSGSRTLVPTWEVGAIADGWLHFMDSPAWDGTMVPSRFHGTEPDRVRVWVSDVIGIKNWLRLTLPPATFARAAAGILN
jgi:hypothetical protein